MDDDDIDDDMNDDTEREDSDPEDHPEDQEAVKTELKREHLGDFKSPFNLVNPASTVAQSMSSIMSPFFTSLAAQASSAGASRFFSPSDVFNSIEATKSITSSSASSGSSLVRPSPPSSPLKPTPFAFSSLGSGIAEKIRDPKTQINDRHNIFLGISNTPTKNH